MASLAVFNQGSITKADLLGIAEQTLRNDPARAASAAALAPAEQHADLVATFKHLILRV